MSDDKAAIMGVVLVVLAIVLSLAYGATRPDTDGELLRQCGNACHATNQAMLSYSKEQGCVCLHQGPL